MLSKNDYKLSTNATFSMTNASLIPKKQGTELPTIHILGTTGHLVLADDFPKVFHNKSFHNPAQASAFFKNLPDDIETTNLKKIKAMYGWSK